MDDNRMIRWKFELWPHEPTPEVAALCRCWLGWVELCIQSWRLDCQTSLINDESWFIVTGRTSIWGSRFFRAFPCTLNTATRRCDMISIDKLTFCFSPNVQHAFCWTCFLEWFVELYLFICCVYGFIGFAFAWSAWFSVFLVTRSPFALRCFEERDIPWVLPTNSAWTKGYPSITKGIEGIQRI